MVSLKDKVVIMTGASGGIGTETCKLLADQGAKLVLGSNDTPALKELEGILKAKGAQVATMILDVTDETQVKEFVNLAVKSFGAVDILLNFAGLSIPAVISEMEVEKYDTSMDVNVKGTFLFILTRESRIVFHDVAFESFLNF